MKKLKHFTLTHPIFSFRLSLPLFVFALCLLLACGKGKRTTAPHVLVFTKTSGWHHESIPDGIAAVQKLGKEANFLVDTTTNSAWFTEDSLKKYAAVIFLNTTEDVLNSRQEAAFERYIQAGGGFVGVHSATDTEYDWRWYGRLVGAYFGGHPEVQTAVVNVTNSSHGATKELPRQWQHQDEWYNFKWLNKDVHTLLTIDEASYTGGTNGKPHPAAWYHEYDGGRSFYTALGHTKEAYRDERFLKHLLGGIQYAIGENKEPDFTKARTQYAPDEDRFVKTMLTEGQFSEPTEMAILPNLDVLIAQRRGEVLWYNNATKAVKQVGFLNVYHQTNTPGVNAEEGLLGIAADPDFKNNHYVYLFYSPIDTSVNRLSRFTFKNDTLDTKSEKVILQFYSQREICCHTGGSIAFGPDNLLYVSTGDNSTPFDEPKQQYVNRGYAPLDDRPGHQQYDARRSAGNTADLRGKILRIKINADGSYAIPSGNLFAPGAENARPEIFVMGNRNPYRISVDPKNGYLYWGEVGPDSNIDSLATRGPRGFDEVNQARKAGFFGWPLFIGNNFAYRQYDYHTGASGEPFNPAQPQNASRNNTGLQQLPPAQPAFIWYPYDASKDFPGVGAGGRTAMAGPVYYSERYAKETRYPDYYNGKLFIYEWMRNWIKAVSMQPNGDFEKMEPFVQGTKFNAPIDMEMGPDGRLYVLEYGSGWFSKNPDAGLARIDYIAGNRPPKVDSLKVVQESGSLPFKVVATIAAKDPEGDALTYEWTVGKSKIKTTTPQLQHTIKEPGEYMVSVAVTDDEKASAKSKELTVYAGNEQPDVTVQLGGNHSFYFPGVPIAYTVNVNDKGDKIDTGNLVILTEYVEGGRVEEEKQGHQVVSPIVMGKSIMQSSDCKSCHKTDEKSIGPSFMQVAQRYQKQSEATPYLMQKIINGSSGVWGEAAMPAHPTMKESDAQQIVQWILSLSTGKDKIKSLPPSGSITPRAPDPKEAKSVLAFTASYTDNGQAGVRPLSATKSIYLRSSTMDARLLTQTEGFGTKDSAGNRYLTLSANTGWIKGSGLDMSGINSIEFAGYGSGQAVRYNIEIRTGSANGAKIGEGVMTFGAHKQRTLALVTLQPISSNNLQDIYLVFKKLDAGAPAAPLLNTIRFVPGQQTENKKMAAR